MVKSSKSRKSLEEERIRISALIRAYGSLLTQRQLSLAQQFCQEGKNFSQIAREREVSRQAVHEAIRSVQQQLELFEMKLHLVEQSTNRNSGSEPGAISELIGKVQTLRQRVASGEFGPQAAGLLAEFDHIASVLRENVQPEASGQPA